MMTEVRPGRQAEVDLMTEATKAEVDWKVDPTIDDSKEGRNLRIARRRRMLRLLGSALGTKKEWAEPLSRRNGGQNKETSTTLLEKVRWKDSLEVFGRRSRPV